MYAAHDPTPTTSPARPAAPSRWLGRSLLAGALVAASIAVTACGSEAPTILNTEKVERAIEQSALTQRKQNARVYCPSGVHQKKGLGFSCTAVVNRRSTRFVVTQSDGSGQVHYEGR